MNDQSMICISCNEVIFTESSRDDEVGFRCLQCDDFTLCRECEHLASEYHPVMHSFIEMRGYHFKNKINDFPNAKPDVTTGIYLAHLTPCSTCQTPLIIGIRYMCTHCESYNLCSGCHITRPSEHQPPDHAFIKIRSVYGLLNEVDWQQELDKSAYFKARNERDYIVDNEAPKTKSADKYKSALKMSSSRNALVSSSNSRREVESASEAHTSNELKLDEQSYFTAIEDDIKDEEDEKKKKETEYTMSYYAEQDDKLADNQLYYEANYDESDDEGETSKPTTTNTASKGAYEDNTEEVESGSDSEEPTVAKDEPKPVEQPVAPVVITGKVNSFFARTGSVRVLINQFQNIIETTTAEVNKPQKTPRASEESTKATESKPIEPVVEPKPLEKVVESKSVEQSKPVEQVAEPNLVRPRAAPDGKINLRGSRAAAPKKPETIEPVLESNAYMANEPADNYDDAALSEDSDSDNEKKPTQKSSTKESSGGIGQLKRTQSRYINDDNAANTYDDTASAEDSASESSSVSESSSSESEVSSVTSDDSDVDDDTFDYYKQHEAFEDIMATQQRDWHKEAMTIQKEHETTSDPKQQAKILKRYLALAKEFLSFADLISRIIIDEAFLPVESKSIKPVNVGGVAGGEKYLFRGVFFKFAIDSHNIYGGDYFAAKAASREYNGVKSYFMSKIKGLYVPMMVLVDYRGLRLIATPCLPINSKTLKYGSADAGQTVLKTDPVLNEKMKLAAAKLNLKGHKAGVKEVRKIYGPTDIEGHQGNDGNYYVIDTARVAPPFPPERKLPLFVFPSDPPLNQLWSPLATMQVHEVPIREFRKKLFEYFPEAEGNPDIELSEEFFPSGSLFHIKQELHKVPPLVNRRATTFVEKLIFGTAVVVATSAIKNAHLYNLLRIEHVKLAVRPLSSDAFSNFQVSDADKKADENNIREEVTRLTDMIVPDLASKLLSREVKVNNGEELCNELHRRGIPVRCLGLLRMAVKQDPKLDNLVLVEMASRMAKMFIRTALRRIKAPTINEQICQRQVLSYFNLIFGDSSAANVYWKAIIKPQLYVKFGPCLTEQELNSEYDIRNSITNMVHLLLRLQNKLGAMFTKEALQKFENESSTCFKDPNPLRIEHYRGLTSECRCSHVECLQHLLNE